MRIRYKLTDENLKTYNDTNWSANDWKTTSGKGALCSPGWLHCYTDPILAAFLNPIYGNFTAPRLLKVEVAGECKTDRGLKEGWTRMRTIKEIPLPKVTTEQRVKFGILCALAVYQKPEFQVWAKNWLGLEDQTQESAAEAAARAAEAATWAAARAAAAAEAAARAAWAAAVAAWAARLASSASMKLNLKKIARKAMEA